MRERWDRSKTFQLHVSSESIMSHYMGHFISKHAKILCTSGPLHLLICLPIALPSISMWLARSCSFKCHCLREVCPNTHTHSYRGLPKLVHPIFPLMSDSIVPVCKHLCACLSSPPSPQEQRLCLSHSLLQPQYLAK